MAIEQYCVRPDWPAPDNIQAYITSRNGGVSTGAFDSLNVGSHVGDEPQAVAKNRQCLTQLPYWPSAQSAVWLNQVHGTRCVALDEITVGQQLEPVDADAARSSTAGRVCVIMTADCLPVLFCSADGQHVAAAHAGWRGLLAGVLETTLAAMPVAVNQIHAWIGPGIGQQAFQVGAEVRAGFVAEQANAAQAFKADGSQHYLADLAQLAVARLQRAGLGSIGVNGDCTFSQPEQYFSYRRDGQCGRMASLIWRAA